MALLAAAAVNEEMAKLESQLPHKIVPAELVKHWPLVPLASLVEFVPL